MWPDLRRDGILGRHSPCIFFAAEADHHGGDCPLSGADCDLFPITPSYRATDVAASALSGFPRGGGTLSAQYPYGPSVESWTCWMEERFLLKITFLLSAAAVAA
jgi:hypothetical protein